MPADAAGSCLRGILGGRLAAGHPGAGPRPGLGRPIDYVFALAATALAIIVTLVLTRWLEDFPFLILLTAVMSSALRGGTGPGLLAMIVSALSILAATHFLAEVFAIPRVNRSDEVVRLVIFVFVSGGISIIAGARRRAEAERDALLIREKAAREQAEAASWAKDRFLAAVSHELRTPLSAILGWASLLRAGGGEQRVHRALEVIVRSAKAQARLIDDLLDVSRIMAGKFRMDVKPTALAPIVEETIETIGPAAQAKRIDLQVNLEPEGEMVMGDRDRLQQAVWNLLSNAVKFTQEGGRVWVVLRQIESYVELRVTDNGHGIAPECLPHLFEPFWQAQSSTTRPGGLGLGLAIVRQIAELHGGTVTAHSQGIGHGTWFRVLLPLRSSTNGETTSPDLGDRTGTPIR